MADGVRAKSCDSSYTVCELCGTFDNLLVCSGCKAAYYCSKEHQKTHWKTHKLRCSGSKTGRKSKKGENGTTSGTSGKIESCHNRLTHDKNEELCKDCHAKDRESCQCQNGSRTKVTPTNANSGIRKNSLTAVVTSPEADEGNPCGVGNPLQSKGSSDSLHEVSEKIESVMTIGSNDIDENKQTSNAFSKPLASKKISKSQMPNGKLSKCKDESGGESATASSTEKKETKLADYVVKCLNDYGICVVDHFMGNEKCDDIFTEVIGLQEKGVFQDGQLVSQTASVTKKIRGDQIAWVEKGDPGIDHIGSLIHRLDKLIMTCTGHLGKYDINGRTKVGYGQYSCPI